MPIHAGDPKRFTPRGIADAYDATDTFAGACRTLQNLIFDTSNPEIMVSRPGIGASITSFGGFTTPTFVVVFISIGVMVYGMISSATFAGHDEPFAYNTQSNLFVPITGTLAGNTPTSLSSAGAWTPPTMAVISTKIIVTHTGFNGVGANFFGVIDITNPAAPTWASANLATNPLPGVPTAVANFNNRAYYAVGNRSFYSDVLVPTTATNAGQTITHGDTTPITCYGGLPIQTSSAGILQSLTVFKPFQIWQVTGDPLLAASPLANNYLSLTLGCNAPRSVVQTPVGLMFVGIDGPYYVDTFGVVRPLTREPKAHEQDVQAPFQNASQPSRICAGFTGSIYRCSMATTFLGVAGSVEYWFDVNRRRWTGPHTTFFDCYAPLGNQFVVSITAQGAKLFLAPVLPGGSSIYNDAGASITSLLETCSLPKDGRMAQRQVVESTVELSSFGGPTAYTVNALDDQRNVMNTCVINSAGLGQLWGSNFWGTDLWASNITIPKVYRIPWTAPLVFQKMSIQISATSNASISMGTQFHRYEDAGYLVGN